MWLSSGLNTSPNWFSRSKDFLIDLLAMFICNCIFEQVCYEGTITFLCCDETNLSPLWGIHMWKTLVKTMDIFYVPGRHLQMRDETRGKICGSIIMTTAAMKYQSAFSTFSLQTVRSRPQERLVESLKQGLHVRMLSSPSKREKKCNYNIIHKTNRLQNCKIK